MREENDWRLTNQLSYFKGATLVWRRYSRPSEAWEHDHCEFCWAKFMDEDHPEILREGYTTHDEYRWVCQSCFNDFRDLFEWTVSTQ
jgi:hypothetical protein